MGERSNVTSGARGDSGPVAADHWRWRPELGADLVGPEILDGVRRAVAERAALAEAGTGCRPDPEVPLHPTTFRPHVSLGYVNRDATRGEVEEVLGRLGDVDDDLEVQQLTLAWVTRRGRHYQWEVLGTAALHAGAVA